MSQSSRPKVLIGSHDYIVYVVDDDARMCEALRELFTSLGVASVTFGSVAEYVAYQKPADYQWQHLAFARRER